MQRSLLVLVAFSLVTTTGWAQPDDDTAPPAPEVREVYVPYGNLSGVFDKLGAGVLMPYDEWLKLWQLGDAAPPKAVDAVITSADYAATIENDVARVQATFEVNVLGKPWVELPIRFGDAAVGRVVGAGDDVFLRGTGDGSYSLLIGSTGAQQITIELAARVHSSPDGREFNFECPAVAVTTLDVTIPDADQTVEVTPRLVTLPLEEEVAAGQTQVRASLGSTGRIAVRWHPRASLRPAMDLLTSVTNLTQVSVEDGLVHTDAYLTYEVLRGELNQVRVAVPADHRILDVTADARVQGWRPETVDGVQVVTIDLLAAAEERVTVEIHTERKLPDDGFDAGGLPDEGPAAGIHALDAIRESGQISVRHGSDLSLTLLEQQGVVRIDTAEVAERIRSDGAVAFKFYTPRFTLRASARPVEPRIVVGHAAQFVFEDDELKITSTLNYTIERAGVFQFVLDVPADVVIDDVQCPAMKEFSFDDDADTLTVVLTERTQGQVNLTVQAHLDFEAGVDQSEIVLPLMQPQGVERETGTIHLFSPESIEVVTNSEGLVAAQPLPAPPGLAVGEARLAAAWSFTRRPVTIPVTTRRKSARLMADVATTIDVKPESATVTTLLDYHVQFSGIDTFEFDVREEISSLLQIEAVAVDATSPALKQKVPADPVDGWVRWTVVMQREVIGQLRLKLTYDLKSDADAAAADDDANASDEVLVNFIRPLPAPAGDGREAVPLSRVRGEVAVERDKALSITPEADADRLESIDIRELTLLPQSGALAYRYYGHAADETLQLTLTRTRHEIEEVVSTVVRRALIEIVSGTGGDAQYHVRARLKTTERQRLRIDLPAGLELLPNSTLDGQHVQLELAAETTDEFTGYFVPVNRSKSSDEEVLLSLQFRWKVVPYPGDNSYLHGDLSLPLVIIGGQDARAAVQELRVAVWLPREFALVGEPENFSILRSSGGWSTLSGASPVDQGELDSWIGGGDSGASIGKQNLAGYVYSNLGGSETRLNANWWNMMHMTIWATVALFLVAWVLGRTSWENKLSVLLFLALVATIAGLRDAHWLAHAVVVARFGLAFLVGWWLVRGLFGMQPAAPAGAAPANAPAESATAPASVPAAVPPPGAIEEMERHAKPKPDADSGKNT